MKATPSTSSGAPKVQGGEKRSFCNTEEIMRKIVPTTMLIDDRARMLIEKCVLDFASSVTNIAVGYCAIDAITTQPLQPLQGNSSLLPNPAPIVAASAAQRELKSSHIMRSLDNMGYAEYQKPLLTYKVNLKGKQVHSKVVAVPPTVARTVPVSAAPVATKKQKGPTGNPIATAAAPVAHKPLMAMPSGATSLQQHGTADILLLIDHQLRHGPEVLTTAEIMRKFNATNFMVSKRINLLKEANVEMKGLIRGHARRVDNSKALQAAKKSLAPPATAARSHVPTQRNISGVSGGSMSGTVAMVGVSTLNNTAPSPSLPVAASAAAAPSGAATANHAVNGTFNV